MAAVFQSSLLWSICELILSHHSLITLFSVFKNSKLNSKIKMTVYSIVFQWHHKKMDKTFSLLPEMNEAGVCDWAVLASLFRSSHVGSRSYIISIIMRKLQTGPDDDSANDNSYLIQLFVILRGTWMSSLSFLSRYQNLELPVSEVHRQPKFECFLFFICTKFHSKMSNSPINTAFPKAMLSTLCILTL